MFHAPQGAANRTRHFGLIVRDETQLAESAKNSRNATASSSFRRFAATSSIRSETASKSSIYTTSRWCGYSRTGRFKTCSGRKPKPTSRPGMRGRKGSQRKSAGKRCRNGARPFVSTRPMIRR